MMKSRVAVTLLFTTLLLVRNADAEESELSGGFYLQYATIKLNGDELMLASMVREGKPKLQKQIYTVQVPMQTDDGKIEMRFEQRARMVNLTPLVKKVVKLDSKFKFESLDGKMMSRAEIAPKFKKARRVVILAEGVNLPEATKTLLREDLIILRGQVPLTQ